MLLYVLRSRLHGRPGALFFSYVGLYSIGRFFIEAIRLDSFWIGPFRVPQLASLAGIIIAIIGLVWSHRRDAALAQSAGR